MLVEVEGFCLFLSFQTDNLLVLFRKKKIKVAPQWSKDYRLKTLCKSMPNCHPGQFNIMVFFPAHERQLHTEITQRVPLNAYSMAKAMIS